MLKQSASPINSANFKREWVGKKEVHTCEYLNNEGGFLVK